MTGQPPDAVKVLIYATWEGRILLFDEPDFPNVAFQVPGGTVEPGEYIEHAAAREFEEETGIKPPPITHALGTVDYRFRKNGQPFLHRRHYFHFPMTGPLAETWMHSEMFAADGSPPIRFRFFWLEYKKARLELGYGMNVLLDRLPIVSRNTRMPKPVARRRFTPGGVTCPQRRALPPISALTLHTFSNIFHLVKIYSE